MTDQELPLVNGKKQVPEEMLKSASNGLRGTVREEIINDLDHFSGDANKLLKFHGMYQQDDRDKRRQTPEGPKKEYSLMIRGRIPGGRLSAAQYLVWDDIAAKYANGTLRLTTRQSIQLHGVLKRNVKKTVQAINNMFLSTTGACGDVVRNVTQAVNPLNDPGLNQLNEVSEKLSDHFKAKSRAYAEIFLNDEQVNSAPPLDEDDPIYGKQYLPRKFKIGVTLAGNNSIDLYTNDMGFAATLGADGLIDGFFVFAGGGLGMTHNKPTTFPRAADLLGWVPADALIPVAEGIVTSHRDYGDRTDRKHARLKYVLADHGVDWFRAEVEKRSGVSFVQKPLPTWDTPDYKGWQQRIDGSWALGFHILTGRIIDRPGYPLKSALREIVGDYKLPIQITADQDLVLLDIPDSAKSSIEKRLAELNINPLSPAPAYDKALACPALPTCGLAITEAERYIPDLLPQIQAILDDLQLNDRAPTVRMTGCPNGCARPYSAEIGLVGRTMGAYAIYIGGDYEGTRVGQLLQDNVKSEQLEPALRQLFGFWKNNAADGERFGDFAFRYSIEELKSAVQPA